MICGPIFSANLEAISLDVTTADIGWPLPIGLPIVTMSGTTPAMIIIKYFKKKFFWSFPLFRLAHPESQISKSSLQPCQTQSEFHQQCTIHLPGAHTYTHIIWHNHSMWNKWYFWYTTGKLTWTLAWDIPQGAAPVQHNPRRPLLYSKPPTHTCTCSIWVKGISTQYIPDCTKSMPKGDYKIPVFPPCEFSQWPCWPLLHTLSPPHRHGKSLYMSLVWESVNLIRVVKINYTEICISIHEQEFMLLPWSIPYGQLLLLGM